MLITYKSPNDLKLIIPSPNGHISRPRTQRAEEENALCQLLERDRELRIVNMIRYDTIRIWYDERGEESEGRRVKTYQATQSDRKKESEKRNDGEGERE